MNELNYPETTKYVIVHNNEIFTNHIIEPQNCFSTGQPYMVVFDTEEEAKQAFPQAYPTLSPEPTLMGIKPVIYTDPEFALNTENKELGHELPTQVDTQI